MENLRIGLPDNQPEEAVVYHIFPANSKSGASLCDKYKLADCHKSSISDYENETEFDENTDCKTCFDKAKK